MIAASTAIPPLAPAEPTPREALGGWLAEKFSDEDVRLATFTFRPVPWNNGIPGRAYAMRAGTRLDYLLSKTMNGESHFMTLERGKENGRLHWHALVSAGLSLDNALMWWENLYGFTNVRGPLSSRDGAALYVSKYVVKGDGPILCGGRKFPLGD